MTGQGNGAAPARPAAAVLVMALGLGAAAAALAVLDAVEVRGVPYREPSRLVVLTGTFANQGTVADWPISQLDFADWRRLARSFSEMSVFNDDGDLALNLDGVAEPERLKGELVSDSYFPLLGIQAERGRFFSRQEDTKPFTDWVTVLSHDLWRRRFGGDPGVIGRQVQLNGQRYRVTGIAPAGFRGLSGAADLWIPSQLPPISEYVTMRLVRWVTVVARLRPGVTIAQAQQEMNRVTADLARRYPDSNKGMGVHVAALADFWYGGVRQGLLVLALGALAVLLAACFDAGLLLRRRLPASLACALAGGVLGLLAAWLATRALLAAGGGLELKSWVRVAVARPEVIAAALALALLCAPAIALAARAGRRFRGLAPAAVAVQAVAAIVLLAATGLRIRDYRELARRPLGFSPAGVLTYRIDIRGPRYDDVQPVRAVVRRFVEQLPAVPGVAQVALADPTIPTDGWAGTYISIEGHPSPAPQGTYTSMVHSVTADYFSLLHVPLLAGRGFGAREWLPTAVVVSKATADKYWPGQSPLGKRIKNGPASAPDPWLTVLGVAAEVRHEGIDGTPRPAPDVYFPLTQFPMRLPLTVNFLVRPQPGVTAASLLPALRRQMQAISPDLPLFDVAMLQERLDRQRLRARFPAVLLGLFAALALVLAAAGAAGLARGGGRGGLP